MRCSTADIVTSAPINRSRPSPRSPSLTDPAGMARWVGVVTECYLNLWPVDLTCVRSHGRQCIAESWSVNDLIFANLLPYRIQISDFIFTWSDVCVMQWSCSVTRKAAPWHGLYCVPMITTWRTASSLCLRSGLWNRSSVTHLGLSTVVKMQLRFVQLFTPSNRCALGLPPIITSSVLAAM